MIVDDQDPGVIWLLRGCPRRWFAPGQSVVVEDAPTCWGKMAVRTRADENAVTVHVAPPSAGQKVELRVVVRHPSGKPPSQVLVNGAEHPHENGVITLTNAVQPQEIVCRW